LISANTQCNINKEIKKLLSNGNIGQHIKNGVNANGGRIIRYLGIIYIINICCVFIFRQRCRKMRNKILQTAFGCCHSGLLLNPFMPIIHYSYSYSYYYLTQFDKYSLGLGRRQNISFAVLCTHERQSP